MKIIWTPLALTKVRKTRSTSPEKPSISILTIPHCSQLFDLKEIEDDRGVGT